MMSLCDSHFYRNFSPPASSVTLASAACSTPVYCFRVPRPMLGRYFFCFIQHLVLYPSRSYMILVNCIPLGYFPQKHLIPLSRHILLYTESVIKVLIILDSKIGFRLIAAIPKVFYCLHGSENHTLSL